MTREPDNGIVLALVNLTEALDFVNTTLRRQAEERMAQPLVPIVEVTILGYLLRHPDASVRAIVADTGLPATTVPGAVRSLERRGLVTAADADSGTATSGYRATQRAIELRATARAQSAQHMRYALASISATARSELERATQGISELAVAFGWQDVDPRYRSQPTD